MPPAVVARQLVLLLDGVREVVEISAAIDTQESLERATAGLATDVDAYDERPIGQHAMSVTPVPAAVAGDEQQRRQAVRAGARGALRARDAAESGAAPRTSCPSAARASTRRERDRAEQQEQLERRDAASRLATIARAARRRSAGGQIGQDAARNAPHAATRGSGLPDRSRTVPCTGASPWKL